MNWGRVLVAGLVAGIAKNIVDFVSHAILLNDTYVGLPEVYSQEQANPGYFVLVAVCIGIAAAILFSKTRSSWDVGIGGGARFGAFLGLFAFFPSFYDPLVIDGFPYYLAWCHGTIEFIGAVVVGAVLGLMIKP